MISLRFSVGINKKTCAPQLESRLINAFGQALCICDKGAKQKPEIGDMWECEVIRTLHREPLMRFEILLVQPGRLVMIARPESMPARYEPIPAPRPERIPEMLVGLPGGNGTGQKSKGRLPASLRRARALAPKQTKKTDDKSAKKVAMKLAKAQAKGGRKVA